jgi:hypothetical protein
MTLAIDNGVDFRGTTAPTDADRLILLPPLAPLAARWRWPLCLLGWLPVKQQSWALAQLRALAKLRVWIFPVLFEPARSFWL